MKFKHYLYATGLLLAGAATSAMVAAEGDAPEQSPDYLFAHEFTPAAGSTVESLEGIELIFPNVGMYDGGQQFMMTEFTGDPTVDPTATNGEVTYFVGAMIAPGYYENILEQEYEGQLDIKVMNLMFIDPEDEEGDGYVHEFAPGEWTINFPEGAFVYGGNAGWLAEGDEEVTPVPSPAFSGTFYIEAVDTTPFEITGFLPAEKTPVKELSTISLVTDAKEGTLMVTANDEDASKVALTGNGETIEAVSFGRATYNDDQTQLIMPINFPKVTEAGEYTLNVPEGIFVQAEFDVITLESTPVKNGIVNAAATGTFVVDPTLAGPFDNWAFAPAAGSTVETLNGLLLQFPELENGALGVSEALIDAAHASNGAATYDATIEAASGTYTCETLRIVDFFDYTTWEDAVFTPGTWTVTIPEGTFKYDGVDSPEFVAEFTIEADEPTPASTFEIAALKPMDGKTVRALNTITIDVDTMGGELMFEPQVDRVAEITLTVEGGEPVSAQEFGEPLFNEMTGVYSCPVVFEPITEAGVYTLNIPEGIIVEYDNVLVGEEYQYGPKEDGMVNAALTATYTVDPNAKNPLEFVVTPADGAEVASLSDVRIEFPNLSMHAGFMMSNQTDNYGMPYIIASGEEESYIGMAGILPLIDEDYEGEDEYKIMGLVFYNEDGDPVETFADGEWTITFRAGAFSYEGDESEEFEVNYVISGSASLPEIEGIFLSPADGSVRKTLSTIQIFVPAPSWNIEPAPVKGTESSITLTPEGGEAISATSYGDVEYTDVDGEPYMAISVDFPVVSEEGTYTLNVPAGVIEMKDFSESWEIGTVIGVNPELTATYTIDPSMAGPFETYSLDPQAGSGVVTLSGIKIMFPEIDAEANISASYGTITATNGEVTYYGYGQGSYDYYSCKVMDIYIVNDMWEPVTFEGGTWTLTIKEGALSYLGEKNAEITAEYFVYTSSEEPLALEETFPANNAEVKKLTTINLMYQLSEGAAINVDMEALNYIDLMIDGDWGFGYFEIGEPSELANGLVNIPLNIDDPWGELWDGNYEITLPAGLFYETKYNEEEGYFTAFDGYRASAEVKLNFTVNSEFEGVLENYTLVPADGETVASLDEVTLAFNNIPSYLTIQQNYMSEEEIMLTNGSVVYTGWVSMAADQFRISFYGADDEDAVVADGKWTLTIPAGYFTFDGEESPAIEAVYNVDSLTGINGVSADNNTVTVITTDGRVVLQNASADKLNGLDKGIYIVNGKKVVIRK